MTISNIFTVTNGGGGSGVSKPTLGTVGSATVSESAGSDFKATQASVRLQSVGSSDSVGISKLAQAMTGPASSFLTHMDDKERGQLDELVRSGRVSAEDVVKGLAHWADELTFMKAMSFVPATEEEISQSKQQAAGRAAFEEGMRGLSDAAREQEALTEEYSQALETGTGDLQDISRRMEEASVRYREASSNARALDAAGGDRALQFQERFARRFQVVAQAKAASGHPDGAVMSTAENKAAADRLSQAGLDLFALKNARQSFSASITKAPY